MLRKLKVNGCLLANCGTAFTLSVSVVVVVVFPCLCFVIHSMSLQMMQWCLEYKSEWMNVFLFCIEGRKWLNKFFSFVPRSSQSCSRVCVLGMFNCMCNPTCPTTKESHLASICVIRQAHNEYMKTTVTHDPRTQHRPHVSLIGPPSIYTVIQVNRATNQNILQYSNPFWFLRWTAFTHSGMHTLVILYVSPVQLTSSNTDSVGLFLFLKKKSEYHFYRSPASPHDYAVSQHKFPRLGNFVLKQ